MAGAGGLAVILLGGFIAFVFLCLTVILIVYGFATRHWRRGLIASLIALVLSAAAVILSAPIWTLVLSGHGSHGEDFEAGETATVMWFLALLILGVLLSIVSALRQLSRRARLAVQHRSADH